MPTWDEVKEFARSKYDLADETEDSFKLVWEYGNQRRQQIVVSCFTAMDRDWCDFTSAACRRDQLDAAVALERNFQLAMGALCLDGEVYVVRYSTALATMDLEEFELPLHVIASTADQLEHEFAGGDDF